MLNPATMPTAPKNELNHFTVQLARHPELEVTLRSGERVCTKPYYESGQLFSFHAVNKEGEHIPMHCWNLDGTSMIDHTHDMIEIEQLPEFIQNFELEKYAKVFWFAMENDRKERGFKYDRNPDEIYWRPTGDGQGTLTRLIDDYMPGIKALVTAIHFDNILQ